MESFYTIQGEGGHQGRAAYFIRLAGCDVGCHWCDVKESWDKEEHPDESVENLVAQVINSGAQVAVITGGEPLMHNLDLLTAQLKAANIATHIETSGAHPLTGTWDWICLSPKKFKAPVTAILPQAHELKVVIFNKSDFDWAEQFAKEMNADCALYLQPEWGKEPEVIPQIINYVKSNPQWRISLQTHKYMNIP